MIRAYDLTGKLIGPIDFIEASWERKWSEAGDFMLYITLEEYNRFDLLGMKYIENLGRPERGIVQKIEYSKEQEGAFVTVSGFFVEKLLDFANYRKTAVLNAKGSNVKTAIEGYISNTLGLTSGYKPLGSVTFDNASIYPDKVDISIEQGMCLGTAIYSMLSGTDIGMNASITRYPNSDNVGALSLELSLNKGRELTSGETGVFFGEAYNNVDSINYRLDESAEVCLYEIIQEVEVDAYKAFSASYFPIKFTETIDGVVHYYVGCTYFYGENRPSRLGESYPKKILTTSLSSDECDLKNTTSANQLKVRDLMIKKAELDMLDNYKIETIEVNIIQERYEYMKDYDLGDRCSVLIDDLNQMYHARIEKVVETHKDNIVEIQLVLGTPSKQKWRIR